MKRSTFSSSTIQINRALRYLAALGATAVLAFGGTVSPQLDSMNPNQPVQIIVQPADTLPGGLLNALCGTLDLVDILPLGEVCNVTVAGAHLLAHNPKVGHISVNNTLVGTGAPLSAYDYTPQTIQPNSASASNTNPNLGRNIGVALIDSGVQINADLIGSGSGSLPGSLYPQVVYAESFVPGESVDDGYGHGTHIAGIISGNGSNSAGSAYYHQIHGVAPGAHVISLKVLDKNGQSSDSQVIKAIDRAIKLKDTYNIKVINLSLGRPIFESYKTDPLCKEVEKADRKSTRLNSSH